MPEPAPLDLPTTPVTPDVAQDVRDYLRDRRPACLDLLRALVETETPSTEPATQRAALDLLVERLHALGFETFHVPGQASGGHLYARPAARERGAPVQLLLGHVDTVWPVGTLPRMPFGVRDGQVRGPGVYDMKSGLVQIVAALDALAALGLDPPATPVVFVNSDEEIGSAESERWIVRLARAADRAFVLEPSLGPEGRLKTARKGVGKFHVVVRGRGSHAGLAPEQGASAILELSHVVQSLHRLNDLDAGISVNVGMIEGGQRANVVAPEARAVVDVRVPTIADARRIEAAILGIESVTPGAVVEITGSVARPPLEPTPRNRRLWERAVEAGHLLGLDLVEGTAGGGSDGNTTSLYTATLDGLGAVGDGAHADHEHIELDGLDERAALLALLLLAPLDDAGLDLP
jgi:glutamate carboxypeptidase